MPLFTEMPRAVVFSETGTHLFAYLYTNSGFGHPFGGYYAWMLASV